MATAMATATAFFLLVAFFLLAARVDKQGASPDHLKLVGRLKGQGGDGRWGSRSAASKNFYV